ncbi:MAG: hypothetical protein ACYCW6_10475, partial [Candidatus Xenobia bacterium]
SAVQQAMAQLLGNLNWQGDVQVHDGTTDAIGRLTFNPAAGVPFSTNNSQGNQPTGYDNHIVPTHMVELIGQGISNGATRTVDALVYIPNFAVSITSTGKVVLHDTTVASVPQSTDVSMDASGNVSVPADKLGPGDLSTNDGEDGAVTLDAQTLVTGNVQAVGSVVPNGATIEGEVRYPWQASTLPQFDPTQYDPAKGQMLNYQKFDGSQGPVGTQNLVGVARAANGLTVNGDITLDNALLYVAGPLVVSGGLKGNGAVVVTGTTTINGGTNLTSNDTVALLSVGDVQLNGTSRQQNQFNGMVYTQGNFTATNVTIVGSFIADGAGSGTGNVTLTGCNAYYTQSNAKVDIFFSRQVVLQAATLATGAGPLGDPQHWITTSDGNQVPVGTMGNGTGTQPDGALNPPWWTPALAASHVNGQQWGGNPYALGGSPSWADNWSGWYWYDTELLTINKVQGQLQYTLSWNDSGGPHVETYTDYTALYNRLQQLQGNCGAYVQENPPSATATNLQNTVTYALGQWPPPTPATLKSNFSFDPNRFLSQKDKMRIVRWVEY